LKVIGGLPGPGPGPPPARAEEASIAPRVNAAGTGPTARKNGFLMNVTSP